MKDPFRELLAFLRRLEEARIHYQLRQSRDEAVMVRIDVPGEKWEVEFVDYGDEVQIEVERFKSNGHIDDEAALEELFARFADNPPSDQGLRHAHETLKPRMNPVPGPTEGAAKEDETLARK